MTSFCMMKMHLGRRIALRGVALLVAVVGVVAAVRAQTVAAERSTTANADSASTMAPASGANQRRVRTGIAVPRLTGRLAREQLGLVVNAADPYSVAVGEYYVRARGLDAAQVLRVELPKLPVLDGANFAALRQRIAAYFGPSIQALALAWNEPYAVACNSITGALALGLDLSLCAQSCAASRSSPYFNSPSVRPFNDLSMRPAMLLAAGTEAAARDLIDRGVAADGIATRKGTPMPRALYLPTDDAARNVRSPWYPPAGRLAGIEIVQLPIEQLAGQSRLILVQTGIATVPGLASLHWLPGALADHLTSFGGRLDSAGDPVASAESGAKRQTTAIEWIHSGATASHGTVSEPCNHLQKFPQPQVLLLHYLQGATAIEAYWKSVAWPQQSLFVGEPLAAPFARGAAAPTP